MRPHFPLNRIVAPVVLAALAVLPIGTAAAFPIYLDFDTIPGESAPPAPGTIISTQYASLGVVFSSPTAPAGGATIFANGEPSSGPNGLAGVAPSGGLHPIYMDFTPSLVSSVNVTLISVGSGTTTATAYASDLTTILDSVSLTHGLGSGNGFGNHDPITLSMGSGSGIARVIFSIVQNTSPVDGFGIDDVSFTTVPTPAPAALLALGGFVAGRRRRA